MDSPVVRTPSRFRKRLVGAGAVLLLGLLALQAVPYGHAHANPPVSAEPPWDSAQTRTLARRACFDCHSNETVWPWYSNLAPISWSIANSVDTGRDVLNLSTWDRPQHEPGEAAESIQEGEMPPANYLWLHPEARLSDAETLTLVQGLQATLGSGEARGRGVRGAPGRGEARRSDRTGDRDADDHDG